MNAGIELGMIRPKRTGLLLRGCRYLFIMAGLAALGYVGLTLLDARLYQASAKRSLDSQIRVEQQHHVAPPEAPVQMGGLLGRMDIPRLGMSIAILQGANARTLRLGAGHIQTTALPGQAGNIGIAAHRDTFFRGLKDIRQDDEIQIQTATGLVRYRVDWAKVVPPDDADVLSPSADSVLTLVTCYPFYLVGPAPNRFVVRAHRD